MIVGNSVVEKKMKTLRMSLQNHPTLLWLTPSMKG